jgi:hypothetical protein
MFSEIALEYPDVVNFVKVPAGSEAARSLYSDAITRPVYITSDPSKSGPDRFKYIDEGQLLEGKFVSQVSVEAMILKAMGIQPTLFATFALTAENARHVLFESRPANPFPNWGLVLFYPSGETWTPRMNRLRVLIGAERFLYAGRFRALECNLPEQGGVYRMLIDNDPDKPLPTGPELWIIDLDTHLMAKYAPGAGEPAIDQLTHEALQAFLASHGVPPPPPNANAFDTVTAWPALKKLSQQQGAGASTTQP